MALHTVLKYQMNTEGARDFEFGDSLTWNLSLVCPVTKYLDLQGELNGTWADKNRQDRTEIADSGGEELWFSPGIKFFTRFPLTVEAAVPMRIWRDLDGTQNAADWKIIVGVTCFF